MIKSTPIEIPKRLYLMYSHRSLGYSHFIVGSSFFSYFFSFLRSEVQFEKLVFFKKNL